jgi:hypothetical protein
MAEIIEDTMSFSEPVVDSSDSESVSSTATSDSKEQCISDGNSVASTITSDIDKNMDLDEIEPEFDESIPSLKQHNSIDDRTEYMRTDSPLFMKQDLVATTHNAQKLEAAIDLDDKNLKHSYGDIEFTDGAFGKDDEDDSEHDEDHIELDENSDDEYELVDNGDEEIWEVANGNYIDNEQPTELYETNSKTKSDKDKLKAATEPRKKMMSVMKKLTSRSKKQGDENDDIEDDLLRDQTLFQMTRGCRVDNGQPIRRLEGTVDRINSVLVDFIKELVAKYSAMPETNEKEVKAKKELKAAIEKAQNDKADIKKDWNCWDKVKDGKQMKTAVRFDRQTRKWDFVGIKLPLHHHQMRGTYASFLPVTSRLHY